MKLFRFMLLAIMLMSCSSFQANNTEEVISEEVWHWCVGNHRYISYNYDYLWKDEDLRNEEIDYTEIHKLFSTLLAAFDLSKTQQLIENNNLNYSNLLESEFYTALQVKEEAHLEICTIWFNMNNPNK